MYGWGGGGRSKGCPPKSSNEGFFCRSFCPPPPRPRSCIMVSRHKRGDMGPVACYGSAKSYAFPSLMTSVLRCPAPLQNLMLKPKPQKPMTLLLLLLPFTLLQHMTAHRPPPLFEPCCRNINPRSPWVPPPPSPALTVSGRCFEMEVYEIQTSVYVVELIDLLPIPAAAAAVDDARNVAAAPAAGAAAVALALVMTAIVAPLLAPCA